MRYFQIKQGHISLETLSEHLDGRLSTGSREKVERHLQACSRCGDELESLRSTVGLLRRVPMLSPRRVFTLDSAPSTAPTHQRLGVPAWASGAVASVAVMIFAVVLSADLGGFLAEDVSAPDVLVTPIEAPSSAAVPTLPPDELVVKEVVKEIIVEREVVVEKEVIKEVQVEREVVVEKEAAIESVAEQEVTAETDAAAAPAAPELAAAAMPGAASASTAPTPASQMQLAQAEDVTAIAPTTTTTPAPVTATVATPELDELRQAAVPTPSGDMADTLEVVRTKVTGGGTAPVWRVLEGVSGGIALLLVAWVLWRLRRRSHSR